MPILIHFTYTLPPSNHITGRPDERYEIEAMMYECGRVGYKPVDESKAVNPEEMQRGIIVQARQELRRIEQQQTANLKAVEKILRDAANNDEPGSTGINIYIILFILSLSLLI